MSRFATGVTVVTTKTSGGEAYGVTVNSFTSVSLDPPLVLVCLDNRLSGLEIFLESRLFAVNILNSDQRELSEHFATRGSDRTSGIDACGETGVPIISGALAQIECEVEADYPGGDHTILVGRVLASKTIPGGDPSPLLFYRGRYSGLK